MTALPFILGSIVLTLATLLVVVGFQDMPESARFLNFERAVLLSITTSMAASGVFFAVVESFRALTDRHSAKISERLKHLERDLGIQDVFSSKSQRETIEKYKLTIASACFRIWAVGLSNNQFLEQHSAIIKQRRRSKPALDVRVHFFDPDASVSHALTEIESFPLVNLFDFPRTLYQSEKRRTDIRAAASSVLKDQELRARVFYVLVPSYFSLMIVDNTAFFFPYLVAPEDASSNPMFMIDTSGEIGERLVQHVEQLCTNPLLCREQRLEQLAEA